MGNRALIKTQRVGGIGLYLHWNGGRDSVEPFLAYCKMQGYRPPERDGYGWARLAQVIGNFFGGTLSVGIFDQCGDYCEDNGIYIIQDWEIIDRITHDGFREQQQYDFIDMLHAIDEKQPEHCQLGDYIDSVEIDTKDLKLGDRVYITALTEELPEACEVVGFGEDEVINGYHVHGVPYVDKYNGGPKNCNNYIHTKTCRIVPTAAQRAERIRAKIDRLKRKKADCDLEINYPELISRAMLDYYQRESDKYKQEIEQLKATLTELINK